MTKQQISGWIVATLAVLALGLHILATSAADRDAHVRRVEQRWADEAAQQKADSDRLTGGAVQKAAPRTSTHPVSSMDAASRRNRGNQSGMTYPERQPAVQARVRAHLERLLSELSPAQREVFGFMGLRGINQPLTDNLVLQVAAVASDHPKLYPLTLAAMQEK